jgi:hypothetical protein
MEDSGYLDIEVIDLSKSPEHTSLEPRYQFSCPKTILSVMKFGLRKITFPLFRLPFSSDNW